MLERIVDYSVRHKFLVLLLVLAMAAYGIYALLNIPIGATPDVTNNQVQVITTSRNLAAEDVEKFLTYTVELEMANLPGVKEIRSVSKFGLSVVTVVFEDEMGTYLPRQLIAEKIKSAQQKIPSKFGQPFMGPISTGLGEIYQYILEVDSAYKGHYNAKELRTIQDWIVRRQMSGIKGVVEINTWGGKLKQYEVAVNPEQLHSLDIAIGDVYRALNLNNNIAGGSYIEKGQQAYFVRGDGLIQSLDDIRAIVITRRNGVPIKIEDIGKVQVGYAPRFGAITANGEGEKVLGQVMMLKGANPNATIQRVKERVAEVEKSLPPGVHINGFLDRSELISRTTHTIAENLILGCLIVVFVVVLLLGDWRSGLVVASVIPLSLLFAISLMYIFDVDANLMSLGAIDFGIIIDGAVIITEFIAYRITMRRKEIEAAPPQKRRGIIDRIASSGASKMMHSAVFGQIIIIIVFIPILSLSGVEGKMFRPMALTFCFALLGTMIMGFTYVPVMSALFVKPLKANGKNISVRLISFLQRLYRPSLNWALTHQRWVLSGAGALLIVAMGLFLRMGGEFVPTLDEGDFVIQPILKTGTSLEQTIEYTTQMERIVLEFPEVEQAVSRIGAAEVPTDPMSMEEIDLIVTLKPKDQWQTAATKEGLITAVENRLRERIPGVNYEFTQPIEMRFNELITGVRADLAVKIYGDDLQQLRQLGLQVEQAIQNVKGAADISLEKTAGLPQMMVRYDRDQLAAYGMNVAKLNDLVAMGFAGSTAGTIYDGERRFDLKLRFDKAHRQDLSALRRALVRLPSGQTVPLEQLGDVHFSTGPARISRDNTRRRIVVGINVRGRDLESVVSEIRSIVEQEINLPPGYQVTYGGQFENLRSARQRLSYAVPVALLLIFILLYFAFNSHQDALLIFSAIPLATVGGVFLLFLRDMPFSISAGVGFIALFGIAVLNGIVLIEEFKTLKAEGLTDLKERIRQGTKNRLRPVLLTASAAALGFLPMAVSTSAGAEVQRPLATVVVGGLVTATLLTLLVLPVLYYQLERWRDGRAKGRLKPNGTGLVLLLLGLSSLSPLQAQKAPQTLSRQEALERALQSNRNLQSKTLQVKQNQKLVPTAFDLGPAEIFRSYDANNLAPNGQALQVWGLRQNLAFPTTYAVRYGLKKEMVNLAEHEQDFARRRLEKAVSHSFLRLQYFQALSARYRSLDSLYRRWKQTAVRRYQKGASAYLEQLTAQNQYRKVQLQWHQVQEDMKIARAELRGLIQDSSMLPRRVSPIRRYQFSPDSLLKSPQYQRLQTGSQVQQWKGKLQQQAFLPDISLEGFQGTNALTPDQTYFGWQVGLSVPLFFHAQSARVQAAKIAVQQRQLKLANFKAQYASRMAQLQGELNKQAKALDYFQATGQKLAQELRSNAQKSYQQGELNFTQYVQLLNQAQRIELDYLHSLYQYNFFRLECHYLILSL